MSGLFPLTPTLFLRERGNHGQSLDISSRASFAETLATILPLPKGESRSEGEETSRLPTELTRAIVRQSSAFALRTSFGPRTSDFGLHPLWQP